MVNFQQIAGLDKLNKEGNDKILQDCLPLVNVYKPNPRSNLIPCSIYGFYLFTRHYTMIQPYFNQQNANFV